MEWITWLTVGQIATLWYFLHFIVFIPLLGLFERPKPLPASIASPVLGGGSTAGAAAKTLEKA
jgi:ubiquinol-cytochrome c reductase cytochrome b subunit